MPWPTRWTKYSPKPAARDDVARGGVDRFARRPDRRRAYACLLRVREHRVGVAHLGGRFADVEHARDVGAVVLHRAAEVAQHDVAVDDDTIGRRLVVRTGRVLSRRDDREVGALVPFREHPFDELAVHVELGATTEGAQAHLGRDHVDRPRRSPQGLDLGVVLHDPQRADDRRGRHERGARQGTLEREHEARPGLVADRGAPRLTGEARDQRDRVVGLVPRHDAEHVVLRRDPRRFQPGHDELRVARRAAAPTSSGARAASRRSRSGTEDPRPPTATARRCRARPCALERASTRRE